MKGGENSLRPTSDIIDRSVTPRTVLNETEGLAGFKSTAMANRFPRMIGLRQEFPKQRPLDLRGTIEKEFDLKEIASHISPGSKVAVAVGSRGIANLAQIVSEVIKNLKRAGAHPFIVPAMGSHGGATAEGQVQILNDYGVSETAMGARIESSM